MALVSGLAARAESLRNDAQELRELGAAGTLFRLGWEFKVRSGVLARLDRARRSPTQISTTGYQGRLPFSSSEPARVALAGLIPGPARDRLTGLAQLACKGRILAFGKWLADYGDPPDWHRSPLSGYCWDSSLQWSRAIRSGPPGEDIKLVWEIGRFPHAFHLARASAFDPGQAVAYAQALERQILSFVSENPVGRGVHWASGQEIAFRLISWLFAAKALFGGPAFASTREAIATAAVDAAEHIDRHIDYARKAVHNNHILSEALALYLVGGLFRSADGSSHWRALGHELLDEQVPRQFYDDGGYIQQSHNYHRLAVQVVLLAIRAARSFGDAVPSSWVNAVDRSLDFLVAQQNPGDGRLPNYGANDGALPLVLSTCDFSDFRPTLQAASVIARGARLYPPGPWDEEAVWLAGPQAFDLPLRTPTLGYKSFADTGFHVLRHGRSAGGFGVFRCGTVKDRFSQIDMLHLDVWWRGHNVLADAGSYLYNGPRAWHNHFTRTACHNTVVVDGRDQMLHFRQFKTLYPTPAHLVLGEVADGWSQFAGEHQGYKRNNGAVVHRRAVLCCGEDLWVVVDTIRGIDSHTCTLQWLGGGFAFEEAGPGSMRLHTPDGDFSVAVLDEHGKPVEGDIVSGRDEPARGWLSRYYGEKVPAPSLAVVRTGSLPMTFVSILCAGSPAVRVEAGDWNVHSASTHVSFSLREGLHTRVKVEGGGNA